MRPPDLFSALLANVSADFYISDFRVKDSLEKHNLG